MKGSPGQPFKWPMHTMKSSPDRRLYPLATGTSIAIQVLLWLPVTLPFLSPVLLLLVLLLVLLLLPLPAGNAIAILVIPIAIAIAFGYCFYASRLAFGLNLGLCRGFKV